MADHAQPTPNHLITAPVKYDVDEMPDPPDGWNGPHAMTHLLRRVVGIDGNKVRIKKSFTEAIKLANQINAAWNAAVESGDVPEHWKSDVIPCAGITKTSTGYDLRLGPDIVDTADKDAKGGLASWTVGDPVDVTVVDGNVPENKLTTSKEGGAAAPTVHPEEFMNIEGSEFSLGNDAALLHEESGDTNIICKICDATVRKSEKCKCGITTMSGSDIAKSGFKAEEIFRTNSNIIKSLEKYFKKSINKIVKAPHGEKYDNIIIFEDGSNYNIQNKKSLNLGGRGDSFDRRHIKNTFTNEFIRKYLTLLTLIRPTKRSTYMTEAQKKDFVSLCNNNLEDIKQYIKKTLIGENNKNDYWCIMKTDKKFSTINLYIIKTETFYNFIENSISINIKLKKNGTCLHLSEYIALQRKGGGNTDHAPNNIQAKLKITQDLLDICEHIL
jgi:hypothetical protein